jgi:hypothetical protein
MTRLLPHSFNRNQSMCRLYQDAFHLPSQITVTAPSTPSQRCLTFRSERETLYYTVRSTFCRQSQSCRVPSQGESTPLAVSHCSVTGRDFWLTGRNPGTRTEGTQRARKPHPLSFLLGYCWSPHRLPTTSLSRCCHRWSSVSLLEVQAFDVVKG